MGDPGRSRFSSFSLPPGCRFYPSDEHLLCYYLAGKNASPPPESSDGGLAFDLIRELDLYEYEPYGLPETACFSYGYGGRRRHWYCYTARDGSEVRRRRRAKGGYWRRRGSVRNVVGAGGRVTVGTRTRFVFYLGNSVKSAVRTDWVMYVYALVDHVKASFVLCRVFVRSRGVNSLSEIGLSSCAEESVSAVRHVGIQHDGIVASDIVEGKMNDENLDDKNEKSRCPILVSKFDDHVMTGPVTVSSLQLPGIQSNELARSSGLMDRVETCDAVLAEQLMSILEEDFIELDDLICPLQGID